MTALATQTVWQRAQRTLRPAPPIASGTSYSASQAGQTIRMAILKVQVAGLFCVVPSPQATPPPGPAGSVSVALG
jgi:hypothetical protein